MGESEEAQIIPVEGQFLFLFDTILNLFIPCLVSGKTAKGVGQKKIEYCCLGCLGFEELKNAPLIR